jgi:hypothetical protein
MKRGERKKKWAALERRFEKIMGSKGKKPAAEAQK